VCVYGIRTIDGKEIQKFCYESPWGGRLDTLKLLRQQVIIEQPSGGLEYESVRSHQYNLTEMYSWQLIIILLDDV
jgi:hypothetical protein